HIPRAQKEQIITMLCSGTTDKHTIASAINVSVHTIDRVFEIWRKTGSVKRRPYIDGRPRILNFLDVTIPEE
ncbi:hypothetical protein BC835DRAFT_1292887, partial [Cytidiella melzeri]